MICGSTSRLNFDPVTNGAPDSLTTTIGGVLSMTKTIGGIVVNHCAASVAVTVSVCSPSAATSLSDVNAAAMPSVRSFASTVVALMSVILMFGLIVRLNSAPETSGLPDSVTAITGGVLSMKK